MIAAVRYPRVKAVEPLTGRKLLVTFDEGTVKQYDCTPLLDLAAFRALKDEALFRSVRVDRHGYAVVWNEDVDLAESELWLNGSAANHCVKSDP